MRTGSEAGFKLLTPREREVLLALMAGFTARDISRSSYVSMATVRSQIRSVLLKLEVTSQLAAVVLAYRTGWPGDAAFAPGVHAPSERLVVGM